MSQALLGQLLMAAFDDNNEQKLSITDFKKDDV